ncbi:hypothetical protein J437_LFUL013582 [Ladona fulva]|uniref:DUF4817 domain-containing protein n=1 Tax=Ladona fulva TaxID=123851 RepID=A0A8K0P236_LADFU|nr:hypothetical protein J437_LFUL013582 [Ladona fulva]
MNDSGSYTSNESATQTVLLYTCMHAHAVFPLSSESSSSNDDKCRTFCGLQFARSESVVTVQRAFRIKFQCNLPSENNIRRWYHQFEDTGCLCKGKSTGRPRLTEERVE